AARDTAVTAATQYHVFGADYIWTTDATSGADEFARRKIPTFINYADGSFFADRAPYVWSYAMDGTKHARFDAEYICKKLMGKPAIFAGDPAIRQQTRKIGLIYEDNNDDDIKQASDLDPFLRQDCGQGLTESAGVTVDQNGTMATAV